MHTGVAGIHIPGPASVRLGTATQALCGLHTRLSTVLYSRSLQNSAFHSVPKLAGLRTSSRQQARQSRHSAQHRAARAPGVRTVAFMAQPKFGKTIVQEAKGVHAATVFVMHGLGDSGEGLAHIGPSLALPHVKFVCEAPFCLPQSVSPLSLQHHSVETCTCSVVLGAKFIYCCAGVHHIAGLALLSSADPTAPEREITMNGGERRNGWFDIYHPGVHAKRSIPPACHVCHQGYWAAASDDVVSVLWPRPHSGCDLSDLMNVRDAPAIGQSIEYVKGLVRDEIAAGTPADRIVIGGFSQVTQSHQYHSCAPHSHAVTHVHLLGNHSKPLPWYITVRITDDHRHGQGPLTTEVYHCRAGTLRSARPRRCTSPLPAQLGCPHGVKRQSRCCAHVPLYFARSCAFCQTATDMPRSHDMHAQSQEGRSSVQLLQLLVAIACHHYCLGRTEMHLLMKVTQSDDCMLMQPVPVAVQQMPVFVGHGDLDPLVPVQLARQTALGLKKAGEADASCTALAPSDAPLSPLPVSARSAALLH